MTVAFRWQDLANIDVYPQIKAHLRRFRRHEQVDRWQLLIRLSVPVFACGVCMVMRRELSQKPDVNMLMTTTLNSALYRRSPGRTQIWMNAALYRGSSRSADVDEAARFVTGKCRSSLQKAARMTSISFSFSVVATTAGTLQERIRETPIACDKPATASKRLHKTSRFRVLLGTDQWVVGFLWKK
jgi:hypothetical protein